MPKIGVEPTRRKSLVEAAIHMIGEQGSLDVSVKEIATRAGMSSGLAFHYFRDKEQIIFEAMRHLLRELEADLVERLRVANSPVKRLDAIIEASFSHLQFEARTVSAWLVFYCHAQSSTASARLHQIYAKRLHSNLLHVLQQLQSREDAIRTAQMLAALIDGLYIRQALNPTGADRNQAIVLCHDLLNCRLDHF